MKWEKVLYVDCDVVVVKYGARPALPGPVRARTPAPPGPVRARTPAPPRVRRMPSPLNTSGRTVVFWDLMNQGPG